jgi:hypothetical protein
MSFQMSISFIFHVKRVFLTLVKCFACQRHLTFYSISTISSVNICRVSFMPLPNIAQNLKLICFSNNLSLFLLLRWKRVLA